MRITLRAVPLGALLLVAAASCGGGDSTGPSGGKVKTVALSAASFTLQVGETSTLTATARDSTGHQVTGRTVTWLSRSPEIVSVQATGAVSAVAIGSAILTATVDSVTDSVTVFVIPRVAFVIVLPQATTVLIPNRLQYSVLLQNANHEPIPGTVLGGATWSVSDVTKATISPTGLLQSVGVGTVVVTARFQSGSFPAFTSTTNAFIVERVGG